MPKKSYINNLKNAKKTSAYYAPPKLCIYIKFLPRTTSWNIVLFHRTLKLTL